METRVRLISDPDLPCRIVCAIEAPTKDAAQAEINHAMNAAECDCAMASFFGPFRAGDGYVAFGEIIERQPQ